MFTSSIHELNIIAIVMPAAVLFRYPRQACAWYVSMNVLQFTKGCHLIFGNRFTDLGTRSSRFSSKQVSRIVTRPHYVFKCQYLQCM